MHQKALLFNDNETAKKILKETEPKIQKQLGRQVKNFDETIWISKREEIMYKILLAKFSQNRILKNEMLKYSNHQFVEASPFDRIWGIGLGENDPDLTNTSKWKGLNLLGNTLTKICNKLKEEN